MIMEPSNFSQRSAKGFGIRAKVTALATIFSVLLVLAVGGVAYQFADDSIARQVASEKIAEAEQLSDRLSRFLQDRLANITTVARVATQVTRGIESANSKVSLEKRQVLREQELADELTAFVQEYPVYSNIGLYDLQGQERVWSRGSAQEVNQKNFPYFQQVLKTKLSTISEPIAINTAGSKQVAIYVAAPVKDNSGRVTAIVVTKTPVEFISNAIFRTSGLQEGRT